MAGAVKFIGLDDLRRMVEQHAAALAYAVLAEVVDRRGREPVARLDVTVEALARYLGDDPTRGEASRSPELLGAALITWVQTEVLAHRPSTDGRSYMLKLYRAKGRYLKSKCFAVERDAEDLRIPGREEETATESVVQALPVPVAAPLLASAPLHPDMIPEARVWRALGAAVEAFVETIGRATGGLVDAQQRVIEQQAEHLQRSWRIIEALTEQLLAERALRSQEVAHRRAEAGARRTREVLVSVLLGELLQLGQVLEEQRPDGAPGLAELFALIEAISSDR